MSDSIISILKGKEKSVCVHHYILLCIKLYVGIEKIA